MLPVYVFVRVWNVKLNNKINTVLKTNRDDQCDKFTAIQNIDTAAQHLLVYNNII